MDLEWEDAGNGDWDVLLQDDDVVEEANGVHIEVTIEGRIPFSCCPSLQAHAMNARFSHPHVMQMRLRSR